jgi:hypothetical protein
MKIQFPRKYQAQLLGVDLPGMRAQYQGYLDGSDMTYFYPFIWSTLSYLLMIIYASNLLGFSAHGKTNGTLSCLGRSSPLDRI